MTDDRKHVDVADIVARLADALEVATAATTEANALKAQLREALGPTAERVIAGHRVSLVPTRTFNAERAATVLPPDLLAQCQRVVIDASTAKELLPPALYAACQVEGALAVRIK